MDLEKEMMEMLGLNELNLNYQIHINGFDGECFMYSVYFEKEVTEEAYNSINQAVSDFVDEHGDDDDQGYISITNHGDKLSIYHDLGNTDGSNGPIHGILNAIDSVAGVKMVIINEE